MASPSQVETVIAVMKAVARRDVDGYLAMTTDDVVLRPSAFITGRDTYSGHEEIREGFAEMEAIEQEQGVRVRITPGRFFVDDADENKVMTMSVMTIIRESGDKFSTDAALLWTLRGDRIASLDAWLDHEEGLAQLTAPVELLDL